MIADIIVLLLILIVTIIFVVVMIFKIQKGLLVRRYKPEDDKSRRETIVGRTDGGTTTVEKLDTTTTGNESPRRYRNLQAYSFNGIEDYKRHINGRVEEQKQDIGGDKPVNERPDKILEFLQKLKRNENN